MAFNCAICGKGAGITAKQLANGNGWLCNDCFKAAGGLKNWFQMRTMSLDEIRALVGGSSSETAGELENFNASLDFILSKNVGKYIQVDDVHKKIKFPQVTMKNAMDNLLNKSADREYDFSDIAGYELIENDNSVTKGGVGAAAVGGALFGGVGMITGGIVGQKKTVGLCNNMRVKVTLRNMDNPVVMIDFLQSPAKTTSQIYLKAQEDAHKVMSMLEIICEGNNTNPQQKSEADEIKKFKELLDMGAITQDEFEAKKKQLLGL